VGLSRLPFANQLQIVTDRSADPQWRETLLALFHLTERPDEVELLLRAVQKRSASHLERLAVSSLLAEACAGPFNCPPSLAKEICQSMIDEIECGVWLPFREHLLKILLSAGLNSIALKDIIYKKIPSWFPDRGWGLSSALEVMGDWPKTPELVNCLIRALHSRPEYSGGSTKALAKCVKEDEAIGERLAQIALGPFSTTIRSAALEAIVDGGPNHPALARAAEQLYNSPEPGIHLACVRWRRHSGLQNDRDLQFLLHLAIDDLSESSAPPASLFLQGWPRDSRVREVALRSVTATWPEPGPQIYRGLALKILIEGYADDPIVRETLTRLIRSGEFEEISFAGHEAWDSLVTHLKGAKDIVEAIDDWIRLPQSTDPMCLSIAALVGRTPTAKNKLIELLASSALPWWTAEGLLKGWGMRDPEASAALLAFASSNEAASIGSLLPQIIEGPKSCAARLFELFRDPNCRYPASVLKGILSLGTFEREELIETAFGFVRRKSIYDHGVAELLMENFGGELRVDDMARKMMQDRDGNFAAVAKFYSHDPELRKRTIDIVTPLPIRLRAVVVGTLIDGAKTNSFCLDMLRFYDFERDMTLKTSAAIAYYSAISATSSAIDADLQRLTETIDCSGPDFRERRRAAFCGLEILGRLDIFLAAQESYPPDRRLDLNIASSLETNVPLVRHILSRWPALKGNLGQHFWPTFSSGGEEWRPFLPLIDEYESPREEALEHIRRSSNVAHSLSIELLEFLARVQPRSRLLRDYCLSCFSGPVPGWNVVRKAAELLGRDFATDEETLQSLPRSQRDWDVLPPVFIALCEAWPNSQRLDEEIKRILKYRIYMGPEAVVLLRSVRSRPERVFRMITRLVAWSPSRSFQILHERYANPIVKRISRDPALRALVAARLASTASASEKTTLPGLLGAARGIDSALRDWCVGEIDRQLSGNFPPEVGFDLLSGQYRPVHEVLYELLAPSLSRSPVSG
jgi:hypothetical protein